VCVIKAMIAASNRKEFSFLALVCGAIRSRRIDGLRAARLGLRRFGRRIFGDFRRHGLLTDRTFLGRGGSHGPEPFFAVHGKHFFLNPGMVLTVKEHSKQ